MKIRGLLILLLILFIGCGVAAAAEVDDNSANTDLQASTIEPNLNQIQDDNIIEENNRINEKIIIDNTQKNTTVSKKEQDTLKDNVKSSAVTFTLTDDTWDNYFGSDGKIKEDIVSEGNVLSFEGEFNDRFMMITVPVNITSGQEQAYLTDCLFYISADNTNITGLSIENVDYDEYIIYMEDVSNVKIENNTLKLTNHDEGITTHTIDIDSSSDVIIKNNEIYTIGPEENLNHDTGVCVTTSINAQRSKNITVDSNNITTEENGNTQFYGTIYGVYLRGNSINNRNTGSRITKNNITTRGNFYMYSVSVIFSDDYIIENNHITTVSGEYADAIQIEVVNNGIVNNNTINLTANNFTYGIYCAGREAREMIYCTNNIISNNTLYAESITTYLIEFWIAQNNTASYNNLKANVDYGTGIGTSQTSYNLYEYNNINMTFGMEGYISNPDAVPDSPTGITITALKAEYGINNTIRYNNITVTAQETKIIPAINLITTNNSVYNNYLNSSKGISNDAVQYTEGNKVYNNYPVNLKNVTIPLDDITMDVGQTESILITIVDEDNNPVDEGRIAIYLDDVLIEEYTLTDFYIIYDITVNEAGTHSLTVNYIPLDDMTYNGASNSSTITVNKIDTQITIEDIATIKYNDPISITGKLTDKNGQAISNANISIYINNKKYTKTTDSTGTYTLTAIAKTLGTNNITISYPGNENYNGKKYNTTFNVIKQDIIITYDALGDVKYRDNVSISGKATDLTTKVLGNINVLIRINGKLFKAKTDSTGAFTLTATATTIGTNNVTLSYGGNTYYNGYESNTTFNVIKQDIIITYDEIPDVKYKDNAAITGRVTDVNGNALGNINVLIRINGKLFKAKTDKTGSFTLTATATAMGTNNVTLSYGGNSYYNGYESNTTFNVEKQDIIITYDEIPDVKYKDNVTITGRVTDVNGNALGKINVLIHINGKLFKAKTDSTGAFTLTATATAMETNNVKLSYGGNGNYNAIETSTTFNVEKQDIIITYDPIQDTVYGDNVTITGRVTDVNSNALGNINALIRINSKLYKAKTDSTGAFTFTTPTNRVGTNNVTLSYGGNACYNSYETGTTFNVIAKTE